MVTEEQPNRVGAPTYRQPLRKAMEVFLMAPFFLSTATSARNAGHYRMSFFKLF